jgi:hypothetical protein
MALTITFLEPGTDATGDFSFWTSTAAPLSSDTTVFFAGSRSIKLAGGGDSLVLQAACMLSAGARFTFYFRFDTMPIGANFMEIGGILTNTDNTCLAMKLNSSGNIVATPNLATAVTGTAVLTTNTWYRISVGCFYTNTTTFRFQTYVKGVADSNCTAGTITAFGANEIDTLILENNSATGNQWYKHIYVDTGVSDCSDPGNILVTAKRPLSNGTTNGFTGQGTPSGYGSGNARYVNERPLNTANYVSMVGAGSIVTEEYNIEGKAVGDVDLTGVTYEGYIGWVFASSLAGETARILVDGVSNAITLTSTPTLFSHLGFFSAPYTQGPGADIGLLTDTSLTTVSLYECGVLIAYLPASALGAIVFQHE